jgi:hypothetical protein
LRGISGVSVSTVESHLSRFLAGKRQGVDFFLKGDDLDNLQCLADALDLPDTQRKASAFG